MSLNRLSTYWILGGHFLRRNPYWWLRRCSPYVANVTEIICLSHPITSEYHSELARIIWKIHVLCVIISFNIQIRKMEDLSVRGKPYWKTLFFIELGKNKWKNPISEEKITSGVGDNVPFETLYRSWAWGTRKICVYSRLSFCRLKWGMKLAAMYWVVRKREGCSFICK